MDNNEQQNSPIPASSGGGSGWIVGVIILVVILGGALYWNMNSKEDSNVESTSEQTMNEEQELSNTPTPTPTPSVSTTPTPTGTTQSGTTKTFTINGENFKFSMSEIKVKKGDTVKIVFNSTTGFHDWVLDEFDAKTPQLQAGQSATVEFVASKTGTFEYYCSVGQHRAMGMKGQLIVE